MMADSFMRKNKNIFENHYRIFASLSSQIRVIKMIKTFYTKDYDIILFKYNTLANMLFLFSNPPYTKN
jgi:hypothetical protein